MARVKLMEPVPKPKGFNYEIYRTLNVLVLFWEIH